MRTTLGQLFFAVLLLTVLQSKRAGWGAGAIVAYRLRAG